MTRPVYIVQISWPPKQSEYRTIYSTFTKKSSFKKPASAFFSKSYKTPILRHFCNSFTYKWRSDGWS